LKIKKDIGNLFVHFRINVKGINKLKIKKDIGNLFVPLQKIITFDIRRRYFRSKMLKLIWHFTHLFVPLHRKVNK